MKIIFTVESKHIEFFFELLSSGIMIEVQSECSVSQLLCGQLQIDPGYVQKRVQTIFLNGRAIDDIDSAIVSNGSVLALSAAMPGLAGAIFRKGGKLSAMRSDVRSSLDSQAKPLQQGVIVLKLFNQVAADLGETFLKGGICVAGNIFRRFVEVNCEHLKEITSFMDIDGKRVLVEEGVANLFNSVKICLSIKTI